MFSRIETITDRFYIGKKITTSFSENKAYNLWHSFMPHRNQIHQVKNGNFFSIEVYPAEMSFATYDAITKFDKWAAVEVTGFDNVPQGLENLTIPAGLYAVFVHKGNSDMFYNTARYIFDTWLPQSQYILDTRPHFEVMPADYDRNAINTVEEAWVPVRMTQS